MNSMNEEKIAQVLDAIINHLDSAELKLRLSRCSPTVVTSWKDEHSLDLVHHCILENNIVALMLLLTLGYFKPPYEPVTWPYLHLVACLGRRTFIPSIIQEIKYQNIFTALDWNVFKEAIKPKLKVIIPELNPSDQAMKLSPIDVAALLGHIGCVKLLLDFWQVHNPGAKCRKLDSSASMYLLLACQANSPKALRLLVDEHSDKKEALEFSLKILAPECVAAVLQAGDLAYVDKAFHGMNLFHVLYSYSSCLSAEQYKAMVDITSILISHKLDVNALRPSRTFPLHSLLCHNTANINLEECGRHLVTCLVLLLQAGANPNLDEIWIEEKHEDAEQNTAFGRRPHSSAINCFLTSLPFLKFNTFEFVSSVDTYAHQVIGLLLKHGADLSFMGKFQTLSSYDAPEITYCYGTALHVMLSTRPQSSLSFLLLQLLLHHGVDTDSLGNWDIPGALFTVHYALNILPFSLWSSSLATFVGSRTEKFNFTSEDLELFTYVMKFMSQRSLVGAYREFLIGVQSLRLLAEVQGRREVLEADHLRDNACFTQIVAAYENSTKLPWPLQRCCSQVVWTACRMCVLNINILPIPGPLKHVIIGFH